MTERNKSGDVLDVDQTTGEVTDVVPHGQTSQEIEAFITGAHVPEMIDEPEAVERAIVAQVLNASTVDEVLADLDTIGLRTRVGDELEISGVEWRKSEYDEGTPFYAIVHGYNVSRGLRETWSTGAKRVMAQLFRLVQLGELPVKVLVRQKDTPTKAGFYPYWLVSVSDTQ